VSKVITQEKINAYALAGGDGNPLHTDPAFAAKTQFGGTIAHGMLVLAYVSEMLTAAFGEDWLASGRLKNARFRAPARPGDTLTAAGTVTKVEGGKTFCKVECRNEGGEVLVSGEAEVSR
jgi:3-hydroxybutyryl-CoA dehydratase